MLGGVDGIDEQWLTDVNVQNLTLVAVNSVSGGLRTLENCLNHLSNWLRSFL